MVFSSSLFLLYFLPIFLIVYYLAGVKYKNLVIVLASIFFYSWGGPRYIFIIFFSILLDFYLAQAIHKSIGQKRKYYMILALSINISFLLYFKYANFFMDNLNEIFGLLGIKGVAFMKVALPIGISFFTFHEMSYIIDVYRNEKAPMKNLVDYSLYILFFPQLIAGPIIRFNEISDQIIDRKEHETIDNKLIGFFRFCIGLAKKVLVANVLGAEADKIFALDPSILNSGIAWVGILAYTFQIYFDFSGYSDMAIGIARMLGFTFPENFNNPYTSQSVTEFWRRWHMTLSRWMRDYLYIPLGGNKVKTRGRLYFNLWLVFFLSGLWHGATWNFIAWGVYQGFFLTIERLFLHKFYEKIGKYPSIVFTFFFTVISWVIFRSDSLPHAYQYIISMFSFHPSNFTIEYGKEFVLIMIVAIFFSFIRLFKIGEYLENKIFSTDYTLRRMYVMFVCSVFIFVFSISSITSLGFNPFIYFRF